MASKDTQRHVKANSLGPNRGIAVPVSKSQCEEMGLDPDEPIEVNRRVFDTGRAEMRLRFRNVE